MRRLLLILLVLAVALTAWPVDKKKKKKNKKAEEEVTQVLELPKDPPAAIQAETEHLSFQVTPLVSKGLLSQQVREGLKWLLRQDRNIVHVRAFVAGTGDMRRVQTLVSETFTEKHLPLPTLTVVQIGALPAEGAQVALEAIEVEKKPVNPNGLEFVAGRAFSVDQPLQPLAPLAEKALDHMQSLFDKAGVAPDNVLSATCYITSLESIRELRVLAAGRFPRAGINFVQPLRGALQTSAACEGAGRMPAPPQERVVPIENTGSLAAGPAAVLIGPGPIVLTGAQLAFGRTAADARLAFQRLAKALEEVKASPANAAFVHMYPLDRDTAEIAGKTGAEFFGKATPPALTVLPFEGLPSMDGSFSVDLIAVIPDTNLK